LSKFLTHFISIFPVSFDFNSKLILKISQTQTVVSSELRLTSNAKVFKNQKINNNKNKNILKKFFIKIFVTKIKTLVL
jgi:hypothetical protein